MERSVRISMMSVAVAIALFAASAFITAVPAAAVTKTGGRTCASTTNVGIVAKGANTTKLTIHTTGPGGPYTWSGTRYLSSANNYTWTYITDRQSASWTVYSTSSRTSQSYDFCVGIGF